MNHFAKFNRAKIRIFLRKMLGFSSIMGLYMALKLGDNLIWYGTLCIFQSFMVITIFLDPAYYKDVGSKLNPELWLTHPDHNCYIWIRIHRLHLNPDPGIIWTRIQTRFIRYKFLEYKNKIPEWFTIPKKNRI